MLHTEPRNREQLTGNNSSTSHYPPSFHCGLYGIRLRELLTNICWTSVYLTPFSNLRYKRIKTKHTMLNSGAHKTDGLSVKCFGFALKQSLYPRPSVLSINVISCSSHELSCANLSLNVMNHGKIDQLMSPWPGCTAWT